MVSKITTTSRHSVISCSSGKKEQVFFFLISSSLAHLAGASLLEGLDQLVEPLRATLSTKAKEGAVQQEVERNDELIRGALRAVYSISRVPNVESNIKWEEFLKATVRVGEIGDKYNAIKQVCLVFMYVG